ncbi:RNA chaperone Hfq [Hydrogenothermus marinus]|uniref:RNA-binding protein Hfq n=1 Tax=Hydrogenothermus marinus TaxID=133270 RepID=A0A3M0BK69_9AQUI|nr:RNA chaperone Hfq [Hydrogenothermus marinus]RMA97730.1 RNA-binding protein Hfq [Hydrogenothermus marinus]
MAKNKMPRIQEKYLNAIRKANVRVNVYLENGVKLEGKIRYFDTFCILLKEGPRQILVYKHAVTTVKPKRQVEFSLEEE